MADLPAEEFIGPRCPGLNEFVDPFAANDPQTFCSVEPISEYVVDNSFPANCTATKATIAINTTSSEYSTMEAPRSSLTKFCMNIPNLP